MMYTCKKESDMSSVPLCNQCSATAANHITIYQLMGEMYCFSCREWYCSECGLRHDNVSYTCTVCGYLLCNRYGMTKSKCVKCVAHAVKKQYGDSVSYDDAAHILRVLL